MDWVAFYWDLREGRGQRWHTVRDYACDAGIHWPVSWWPEGRYGAMEPEPCWACEWCGRECLPYRAPLWSIEAWFWTVWNRITRRAA